MLRGVELSPRAKRLVKLAILAFFIWLSLADIALATV